MDDIPVDVAIRALQAQVEELKRLAQPQTSPSTQDVPSSSASTAEVKELRDLVEKLQTANAKAEYRISFLLRTLEEKDKQCK